MKRIASLVAALALAACLVLTAVPAPAGADDSPTPTPTATDAAPTVIRTPWVKAFDQWCEAMDATHFYYGDGGLVLKRVAPGVTSKTVSGSGEDVTDRTLALAVGTYTTTFAAPEGAVFAAGATVTSETIIFSADPCGKPAVKVKRGSWHVVKVTAHRITLQRTVKTTRYHANLEADGMGGEWLAKTKASREKITVRR